MQSAAQALQAAPQHWQPKPPPAACIFSVQQLPPGWAAGAHSHPSSGVGSLVPSDDRAATLAATTVFLVAWDTLHPWVPLPTAPEMTVTLSHSTFVLLAALCAMMVTGAAGEAHGGLVCCLDARSGSIAKTVFGFSHFTFAC